MAQAQRIRHSRTVAAFLATGLLWGSAWIAESRLRETLPGCYAGPVPGPGLEAARYGIAALALGFCALPGVRHGRISQRAMLWAVGLGVVQLGLPFVLAAWAGAGVSPGVSVVSFALMPLFALLLGGRSGEGDIPLVVLGTGGVTLLGATSLNIVWRAWPMLTALLAAVILGAAGLLGLRRVRVQSILEAGHWAQFCAIQSGAACVFLAVVSLGFRADATTSCTLESAAVLPLVLLALPVTAVTLPLLFLLAQRMDAWRIAALEWLTTLIAVMESHRLYHARPSWLEGLGAAILAGCLVRILGADESFSDPGTSIQPAP